MTESENEPCPTCGKPTWSLSDWLNVIFQHDAPRFWEELRKFNEAQQ